MKQIQSPITPVGGQVRRGRWYPVALLTFTLFVLFQIAESAAPELALSSTVLTPQLGLVAAEEQTAWRNVVQYRQMFTGSIAVQSLFEYGSVTDRFQNPFRLYALTVRLTHRSQELVLGRIPYWDALLNARIDGIRYRMKVSRLGRFGFLAGVEAATDFNRDDASESQLYLLSWTGGRTGKTVSLTLWDRIRDGESRIFTGVKFRGRIAGVNVSGVSVWNLVDSRSDYQRFWISKQWGKHQLAVGYRHRRLAVSEPYPWVTRSIRLAPTAIFEWQTKLASRVTWRNQVVYRATDDATTYLHSSLRYRWAEVSLIGGQRGDTRLWGGQVGVARGGGPWRYGVSLAVNTLLYEDLLEPQNSSGVYGWLQWRIGEHYSLRLFVQNYRNPYYSQDVRGGLTLHVAL
jgi:hypothetical protein